MEGHGQLWHFHNPPTSWEHLQRFQTFEIFWSTNPWLVGGFSPTHLKNMVVKGCCGQDGFDKFVHHPESDVSDNFCFSTFDCFFRDGCEVPIIHRMIRVDAWFFFSNSFGVGFDSSAVPKGKHMYKKKHQNTQKYQINISHLAHQISSCKAFCKRKNPLVFTPLVPNSTPLFPWELASLQHFGWVFSVNPSASRWKGHPDHLQMQAFQMSEKMAVKKNHLRVTFHVASKKSLWSCIYIYILIL